MAYGDIEIGTKPLLIIAANGNRRMAVIHNLSSRTVFLGEDKAVTIRNGFPVPPNSSFSIDDGGQRSYHGDIYGISTDTSDIRFWFRDK